MHDSDHALLFEQDTPLCYQKHDRTPHRHADYVCKTLYAISTNSRTYQSPDLLSSLWTLEGLVSVTLASGPLDDCGTWEHTFRHRALPLSLLDQPTQILSAHASLRTLRLRMSV